MTEKKVHPMNVIPVNIMGKAGILEGDKGDIMIHQMPTFLVELQTPSI
jgi:hypothetical protein